MYRQFSSNNGSSTAERTLRSPSRERCCFCVKLQSGTVAIAVFYIVLYGATAICSTVLLANGSVQTKLTRGMCYHMETATAVDGNCQPGDVSKYETWVILLASAGFVISVVAIPVAAMMMHGVLKDHYNLILPMFIWNIVDILRDTICFFSMYKLWGALPEDFVPVFVVLFFILQSLRGYFISPLWAAYRRAKLNQQVREPIRLTKQVDPWKHMLSMEAVSEKAV
ncbi:lysosomal-associated transmembrane protein 4B-like [Corticium candelabrum]|uniref:lysosomal-associated transmembrane protein 4B-like n=1 Tax=Corticium candelabrum TaxID=121492 RepID=UPI002E33DF8C|nr:lysosomal-associated transmembrane protein 4B-like [Corticium candelabrum]